MAEDREVDRLRADRAQRRVDALHVELAGVGHDHLAADAHDDAVALADVDELDLRRGRRVDCGRGGGRAACSCGQNCGCARLNHRRRHRDRLRDGRRRREGPVGDRDPRPDR